MDAGTLGMGSRADAVAGIAIVLVCAIVAGSGRQRQSGREACLAGLVAVIVSIYIGERHPLWLYWEFAVVMGARDPLTRCGASAD
jgi:hypothetical protein